LMASLCTSRQSFENNFANRKNIRVKFATHKSQS
jgi:hypothetical protein